MSSPGGEGKAERERGKRHSAFETDSNTYARDLARGLQVSGEGRDFFARGRIERLSQRLDELGLATESLLDFGCGDGASTELFREQLKVQRVTGVDRSRALLQAARANHAEDGNEFLSDDELVAAPRFDGAFTNGVFHHLALEDREPAVRYVYERLRPGAWFALCENNPWNPGTRWVMSRIEFDRDAILLPARRARDLLRTVGFDVLGTDYLFFFPRSLGWLRGLEPALRGFPFGAQYMILARK